MVASIMLNGVAVWLVGGITSGVGELLSLVSDIPHPIEITAIAEKISTLFVRFIYTSQKNRATSIGSMPQVGGSQRVNYSIYILAQNKFGRISKCELDNTLILLMTIKSPVM